MDFLQENQRTLENIQRVIEEKQRLRGTLDDTIQILNEKVNGLTEQYENMMRDLAVGRVELPTLKAEKLQLESSLETLKGDIVDATKELERLDEQLANRVDLTETVKTLQIDRDRLKDDISTEQAIKDDLEGQNKSLRGLRNTLQSEVEYLETKTKELQPELDKNQCLLNDILKEKEHAQNLFDNADKVLREIEVKKKEFIENPLSIGYYAGLIKKKHGIDIIKLMV